MLYFLAQKGRRWDKTLLKDEAEPTSLSWLNGKEAWYDVTVWWCWSEEMRHRGGEREETTLAGLTGILLDQKMKKIHVIDSAGTNERWKFKATMI
jgi:hypothetical protein